MGYVNKIQIDEDAAHLIEPTLYGICSTAAATAIKDITLDSFTLIPGVQIAVKFTVTNTAAVSGLKLRVNSTNADDAKPIKYRGADLPDKGTLANKRVYLFLYDGTNWEFIGDIDTNTNTNTLQRTFRSSSNVELPIAGINASNSATATYNTSSSISSGSYASMYAAIPNTVANLATINPSTGKITVPGGVVADVTGNASTATNVALSGVTDAENLQAIEALTGTSGFLKKTDENTWSLDTSSYVTSSGVTSITIKTSSPLTGGSDTATTSTGTYTIGFSNQNANTILAGPSSGSAAAPTFRALTAADIPSLSYLPLAGGTMTGDLNFTTIGSWPVADGETYPISSKGIAWSGSSDGAKIFYRIDAANNGNLIIQSSDDGDEKVIFRTTHSNGDFAAINSKNREFYPINNNTGSLGTSSYKWASVYATNFYGSAANLTSLTGASSGNYGPSAAVSGTNGTTMNVPYITVDANGRITAISNKVYTAVNTWRGIQDNLTSSTNTTQSLSAKQGYLLANGSARDNTKVPLVTSTDNAIVRFDGTSGQVQDSGVKIDDSNNITGFNSFKYNTRYYPFIKEFHSRTKWYKITFPYSTATTNSNNHKWFMNSFDIHIGGGYSANAAGVIHVIFYWLRLKDNGAWSAPQVSAKFDGILMNKVKLYYRIAEPGVLYVNNESNTYNGIWITDLYNDDTASTLDWTTTTITSCDAITSSTNPALSAYTQVPSVYTYTDDSTYCIDNLTQLTKNFILYNTASSGDSPSLIFKRASNSTLTDWRIFVTSGKLSFCTALDGTTWTERASFADNSGNFTVTGTMTATNFYGDGANITLGTASAAVVTDASKKLTTRGIKNITGSANNLEWTSSNTDNTLVTTNTLAYWNGRYNSTSSNLTYCKKGEFGTIITNNFPTSNTTTTYLRGDGSWVSLSDMGLSTAMHYKGTVEASPTTTAPTGTFVAGDVVVYDSSEYVYDGTGWRELGSESSFKTIQDAVSSPSVSSSGTTTATAFIDTISQDANGVITATKKNLPTASTSTAGIIQIGTGATNAMAGNTTVTNVTQSESTTTTWRKILLSGNTYSTYNAAVSATTGQVYEDVGMAVQPSTHSLRAAGTIQGVTLKGGNLTIGGTVDSAAGKTISSNSTLYFNRANNTSIIFQEASTATMRIDPDNYFRPETDNTLQIGTSDYKWNAMYATTFYGDLSGNATSANYIKLYEARGTTTTLNKAANYVAAGAMFHLVASSDTSATDNGKTPTDANILQMNWDNNGGYDAQLGIATAINRMYFRAKPSSKTAWDEVAHAPVGTDGVGGSTQPVYMTSAGVITACTSYANASVNYATSAGSATTADAFSSGTTVKLTGDTTGESSSSTKGWEVATTTKYLSGTQEAGPALTTSPGTGKIKYSYNVNHGTTGSFTTTNNANSIITFNRHNGNYDSQLGFSSNGNIYYRNFNASALDTTTAWKQIAFIDSNVASATAIVPVKTLTESDDENILTGTNQIAYYNHINTNRPANCPSDSYNSGLLVFGNSRYGQKDTFQLEWSGNTQKLYMRGWIGTPTTIPSWNTIIHSGNYTDYTVTKTGSGASGTWDISITGSSASCTGNAATASKLTAITSTDAASSSDTWRRLWIAYNNNTEGRPAYTDSLVYQTSTNTLKTPHLLIEHTSGGQAEIQIKYSSTIDYWWGVGTGNESHGLYDRKAAKWILSAAADNKWIFVGNVTGTATTASKLSNTTLIGNTDRPVYFTADGVPAQTTYRMAGTNATATTGITYSGNLDTGIWYVNGITAANNPVTPGSTVDGAMYVNKYSDSWIHEIYGDYRTGQIAVRGKNNGAWQAWRKILDSTNYTDYTVTKTGSGASGSWEISITGNATSATKVAAKLAATTKTYLLGTSTTIADTAANVDLIGDTGIYATTTAGELSAVRHSFNVGGTEKAYITYNSTDNSLDFVFV